MGNPWLRLRPSLMYNPPIASLNSSEFRSWITTLCYAAKADNKGDTNLTPNELSWAARLPSFNIDLPTLIKTNLAALSQSKTVTVLDWENFDRRNKRLSIQEWRLLRNKIFLRDDYTCQYCGERGKKLECDHVIPVSKGGEHIEANLVTACFKCNRSKGSKLLKKWRKH